MRGSERTHDAERHSERRWAILRIVLGTAQIMAATVAIIILLSQENAVLAIAAGAVALALIVLSRVLFGRGGPDAK